MKKRMVWRSVLALLIFCLLALPALPVAAQDAAAITAVEETAEIADESWAKSAVDFLTTHWADLVTSAALIWSFLPKIGLVSIVKKIRAYFDDKNNQNSIYNVLSGAAGAQSRFMNDAYPLLAAISSADAERSAELKDLARKLSENAEAQSAKIQECFLAMRDISREFGTLMEIASGAADEKKAEIFAAWSRGVKKLEDALQTAGDAHDDESKGAHA